MDVRDKEVLLTGAAGGLGTAIALAFARAGARVQALDQDAARGERLAAALAEAPADVRARVQYVAADLADLPALRERLDSLFERAGGADIVINNAAVYPSEPIEAFSIEAHQQVMRVNADAALVCVQAALPYMKRAQFGRIINVTSITLYGGWANLLPYVTSKGALQGMARALARELGEFGITANCVSPGAFPTDAEKIHPDPEGYQRFVLDHQAVKRRGTPADIANAMLFLASAQSGFITGQTLNVDGGWVMQ